MKLIALVIVAAAAGAVGSTVDLDALLDERTKINEEYKQEYVELAEESEFPERMAAYEAAFGDAWLKLIAYAKQSGDDDLKRVVLKIEYYDELIAYLGEVEYAETNAERREAQAGLDEYEAKLKSLLAAQP